MKPEVAFPEPFRLDSEYDHFLLSYTESHLSRHLFTGADGLPDYVNLKNHFLNEGRLQPSAAIDLIQKAKEILAKEPNVLMLKPPLLGKD